MDAKLDDLTNYIEEEPAPKKKAKKTCSTASPSKSQISFNKDKTYLENCLKERDNLIMQLTNKNDDQLKKNKDIESNNVALRELYGKKFYVF